MLGPEDSKALLRQVSKIRLATRRLSTGLISGEYRSAFRGQGMEFDQVREYVPGDEPRQLDWNVTARFGHPFVKSFVEERSLTLLLLVDCSASTWFGSGGVSKRELMAQLAAVLALNAVQAHDRVGLLLYGPQVIQFLPPQSGRHQALRLVRDLLDAPATAGSNLQGALEHAQGMIKGHAVMLVLSDFFDLNPSQPLRLASHRHDLLALEVLDPFEINPFNRGFLELKDLETGEQRWVDTDHRPWQAAFTQAWDQRQAQMKRFFAKYAFDHVRLLAGEAYEQPLRRFFQRRSRRR